MRPRVLLADDHAGFLAALQRLLAPSCEIVGQVTSGSAVLEAATRMSPQVVVLDIAMPGLNGLEACRQIKEAMPQTVVIMLTATIDQEVRKRAFELGASCFVAKNLIVDDLLPAIQKELAQQSLRTGNA